MARPKKSGPRFPDGIHLRPPITANHVRRHNAAALSSGRDPWLGTQIGRLATYRTSTGLPFISPDQCEAGLAFAKLAKAYAQEMGLPARAARSCVLEGCHGHEGGAEPTERTSAVLSAYRETMERLEAVGATSIVVAVCVDDQAPASWEIATLVRGLNAITP
jgi:hypothetical protein